MKSDYVAAGILAALAFSPIAAAALPAAETASAYELTSGVVAVGSATAEQSARHFKSGDTSLRWAWTEADGGLELRDKALGAPGVGFWIHNESPRPGHVRGEFVRGGKVVGTFRIRLDFKGWRPVVIPLKAAGAAVGKPEMLRLMPPAAAGELYLDGARFDLSAKEAPGDGGMSLPESIVRSDDISAPEPSRPWLNALRPTTEVTAKQREDMLTLETRLLPAVAKPGRGLAQKEFDAIVATFAEYRIRRDGDTITGTPIIGSSVISPKAGIPLAQHLNFLLRVANAYAHADKPAQATTLKGMFADLCVHFVDQGWVPAGEERTWANYPNINLRGLGAMRDVMKEAGVARDMAHWLAWAYGNQASGEYLGKSPFASMDGCGFWLNELPVFLSMLPDEKERLFELRAAKRAYDMTLVNPHTLPPDGAPIHHGAFHFAYASYNMPRLVSTIRATLGTEFFIDRPAQERLRTYARTIAFTVSAGVQPYNLGARAGTPLSANMGAFAISLAELGSPDRALPYDPEMAALALSQFAESGEEGAKAMRKPPLSQWIAAGVKPEKLTGFLAINTGPVAVYRRPGWLLGIAGETSLSRGLEIYGWTKSNNYGRFARLGSLCLMLGETPSLAGGGWDLEGWDWSRFPGTTAPRLGSRDLFEGYTMSSNRNALCGGAGLDGAGVWGMDADIGAGVTFKQTVFCFDDTVTVLKTGIASASDKPVLTNLFQNSIRPGHTEVSLAGETVGDAAERKITAGDATWILDNRGVGYLIPAGNAPLTVALAHQRWTYMVSKYLKDPKQNPFPSNDQYRYWSRKGKDMNALEAHYRPSEGDFASAWIDHGPRPSDAAAQYTMIVGADAARMRTLAAKPPVTALVRDSRWHVLRHDATGTEAYAIYAAGTNPGEGLIRASDKPCFAILKTAGSALKINIARTDIHLVGPVKLTLKGAWKTGDSATAAPGPDGTTVVEFTPDYSLPTALSLTSDN